MSSPLNILAGFFLDGLCQCFPFNLGNHMVGACFEKFDCCGHEFAFHASATPLAFIEMEPSAEFLRTILRHALNTNRLLKSVTERPAMLFLCSSLRGDTYHTSALNSNALTDIAESRARKRR